MSPALPKPTRQAKTKRPITRRSQPIKRSGRIRKVSRKPAAVARRKADREWAEAVEAASSFGWCQRCSMSPGRDAHHIRSRRYKDTRHLLINGLWLCRPCHNFAHRKPLDFRAWLKTEEPRRWGLLQTYWLAR